MQWVTGDAVVRSFTTQSAAGTGTADADSTPTGTLVISGVDNGATVTVTRKALGSYKAAVVLPTIADGATLELRISASVGGVAGLLVINIGQGVSSRVADVDGFTHEEAMRLILSSAAAKLSGAETTQVSIRAADDSKDRIIATVDSSGNRTAVSLDGA